MRFLLLIFTLIIVCCTPFSLEADSGEVVTPVLYLLLRGGTETCLDNDKDNFFVTEGCGTPIDCNDNDPNIHPEALDTPDINYRDDNCDGIDGDKNKAIFVSTIGNNNNNGIDPLTPKRTVESALQAAGSTGRKQILIQQGIYNEIIDMSNFQDGGLYGNYALDWSRSQDAVVEIRGGYYASNNLSLTIRAHNSSGSFYDLKLVGPDAIGTQNSAGRSSYTVHAKNSTLGFYRITFIQGAGSRGSNGSNGTWASQTPASSGEKGEDADSYSDLCDSSSFGAGGNSYYGGGTGGDGGTMDTECSSLPFDYDARPGNPGDDAVEHGSDYGKGGISGFVCSAGGNGQNGITFDGTGGIASPVDGVLSGDYWYGTRGGDGELGDDGTDGGGGGGSGGCDSDTDSYGAGGGGGGTGGYRAPVAGTGGFGGGGSFGIFVLSSTIEVHECSFVRGNGGRGGSGGYGGKGQPGGSGGPGGNPAGDSDAGGDGGDGGPGGYSGGGAGGVGGYSYGIFYNSSTITETNNTFSGGSAGAGGIGGTISGVQNGQNGPSGILGAVGSM